MCYNNMDAGVAESADATDSKSVGSDIVRVQVPPPAPNKAPIRKADGCLISYYLHA